LSSTNRGARSSTSNIRIVVPHSDGDAITFRPTRSLSASLRGTKVSKNLTCTTT